MGLKEENSLPVIGVTGYYNALPLAGLRFLIVDSDWDSRVLLTYLFEEQGAKVAAVASVKEGLEIFQHSRPDVLISEIWIPDEDGYSLIRRIRSLEAQRGGIPVLAIALTAYTSESARIQALMAGFHKHFAKPIDLEKLIAGMSDLMREKSENPI